jgi:hypothetical protein
VEYSHLHIATERKYCRADAALRLARQVLWLGFSFQGMHGLAGDEVQPRRVTCVGVAIDTLAVTASEHGFNPDDQDAEKMGCRRLDRIPFVVAMKTRVPHVVVGGKRKRP